MTTMEPGDLEPSANTKITRRGWVFLGAMGLSIAVANSEYWDVIGPFDPTDGRPTGEDIRADYMTAVEWPGGSGDESDARDLEG